MHGISLLVLVVAGANASPHLNNVQRGFYKANALLNARSDTPTDASTTTYEEPPPSTTTTVGVDTLEPEPPQTSCDSEDGGGCTSTSSFIQGVPTKIPPTCSGTASYTGTIPPTVYATVTETYTASSGNGVQMADDETLITPPPPCSTTFFLGPFLDGTTSTVLVTKKTHVPYSEPTDPPSFTDPPDNDDGEAQDVDCEDEFGTMCNVLPPEESPDTPDSGCPSSDSDCDSSSDEASSSSGDAPSESATGSSSPDPSPNEISDKDDGKADDDDDDDDDDDGSIRPIVLSGVPIVVGPSTIRIGSQIITDFPSSPAVTSLVANGQAFTINESEVIGPKTTIPIPTAGSSSGSDSDSDSDSDPDPDPDPDTKPTLTPITAADLTFSIGPSEAVISGTTLTIGPDSTPTTTVIDGKTISIGPDGVGFPSTTVAPPTAPTATETGGAVAGCSTPNLLGSIAAFIPFLGAWGLI